jgi:hypothetical protein
MPMNLEFAMHTVALAERVESSAAQFWHGTETNPFMQVDAQVTPVLGLPSNISPVLSRQ